MPRRIAQSVPVLVIDEQELFRMGLCTALKGANLAVVGEYGSVSAVLQDEETIGQLDPGTVVVCSLTLTDWDKLVYRLLLGTPEGAILGIVDETTEEVVIEALGNGVLGCMDRTLPPENWVESIQEMHAGTFSPVTTMVRYPGVARHALMLLSQPPEPVGMQPLMPLLIDRERLALGNISEGVPLEAIVERMGVPEQTVYEVLESACRKLVARHRLSENLGRIR